MSSFVINKIEFVKAAGLMYGIEESKRIPFRYFLDNVRDNFVRAFEFNALSVAEQYGDDTPFTDDLTYSETFDIYRAKGAKIWQADGFAGVGMTRKDLRNGLTKFFHSVLYQIENREMYTWTSSFFWECVARMDDAEVAKAEGWWGEVEI